MKKTRYQGKYERERVSLAQSLSISLSPKARAMQFKLYFNRHFKLTTSIKLKSNKAKDKENCVKNLNDSKISLNA